MSNPLFKLDINPTFRDFDGRFARADKDLLNDRRDGARDLGRLFVGYAADEAPKRTGDFAKGIKFRTFQRADSLGFTISDPQPLGKWIRLGTKPHSIRPKRPGYPLAFYWPKIGGMMFTYHVNHPGTKPNAYIDRARARWEPDAQKDIKRISTRYVTTIAKGRAL